MLGCFGLNAPDFINHKTQSWLKYPYIFPTNPLVSLSCVSQPLMRQLLDIGPWFLVYDFIEFHISSDSDSEKSMLQQAYCNSKASFLFCMISNSQIILQGSCSTFLQNAIAKLIILIAFPPEILTKLLPVATDNDYTWQMDSSLVMSPIAPPGGCKSPGSTGSIQFTLRFWYTYHFVVIFW